jgi:cation diffusion facilitator CzcD-associated flavoprotein CzcO
MIDAIESLAASTPPAGGAATGEIAIATVSATLLTLGLLWVGSGHRSGRIRALGRLAGFAARVSGQPAWAALPSAIASLSLLTAVLGMYWDIALHIDVGRDEGPLANPAHYFILAGLYGIFSAGFVAMVLPDRRPGPSAVRLGRDWHAPLGGVLICACGAFALLGFPLDDMWHRLFGQDVTLWGPTHLMLIGGASMTLVGIAVLQVEGRRAQAAAGAEPHERGWVRRLRLIALTGGLLLGMSTFQAEFDFGVGQFRLVLQPMLIMLAAGAVLVAARIWLGRGAALGAALFFLAVRGGLTLLVGPVLGETAPHFPLYLAEAALVELVALAVPARRPLALGAASGVLIGTVGLAAEWGFTHVWMPLPWTAALLPEGALLGLGMAVAGSLLGAWIGAHLAAETLPLTPALRLGAVGAAAAVVAMLGLALYTPAHPGVSATVALRDVDTGPERQVQATVALDPPDAGDDAAWLTATAWQGGGLVVDRLRRVGEGTYRTTQPIPVHGSWKAMVRLHYGNAVDALPLYLPRDDAIPAPEVPATARFTREFEPDSLILQREQRSEASGALTALAYGVVAAIAAALLALLAWGLHRLAVTAAPPSAPPAVAVAGRRPTAAAETVPNGDRPHFEVAIVGAGFGGLGMAAKLRAAGIDDFVVLERDGDVGGTWWANTYPGCQCDIPSHLYSFSFAPNPDWTRTYAPQPEIWRYLRDVTDRHDLRRSVRFGCELTGADWDEQACLWRLETTRGPLTASVVVAAPGGLSEPSVPAVPGLDAFDGEVFHTARWNHDYDLRGRRVAVIGTGASAIQVVPEIQPLVERLTVFQRTPPWVVPHRDRPITALERRLYRRLPAVQRLVRAGVYWSRELLVPGLVHRPELMRVFERVARRQLEEQVADPELRARLTPSYRMGCKRILPSSRWYPALTQPNVDLVFGGLDEVRSNGVVTPEGDVHEVDAIVFATGFHVTDMPLADVVRDADGASLSDVWRRSPQAYRGTAVAGFPNLFWLVGPNTGLGHNSIVFMLEAQLAYVMDALATLDARGADRIEVRRETQDAYNARLQRRLEGTVWNSGGCASWYLDANGRNSTIWPDFTWRFWRESRRFDAASYELSAGRPRLAPPPATLGPSTG